MRGLEPCAGEVVLASKPLAPPWNDGSKVLVRELAGGLARLALAGDGGPRYRVVVPEGVDPPVAGLSALSVSPGGGNAALAVRLALHRGAGCFHFFFAPHRAAVAAARAVCLPSGAAPVQTIPSRPRDLDEAARLCFGLRVVVLSRWSRDVLVEAGVDPGRIRLIPPPLSSPTRPSAERRAAARRAVGAEGRPLLLFPGDAEPGGGLRSVAEAAPELARETGARVALACRTKTAAAADELGRALRTARGAAVVAGSAADFPALLAAADLCLLPAESLHAKVDYPYALLEAMALGIPAVVAAGTPAEELAEGGALVVPPRAPRPLARAVAEALSTPGRTAELGRRGAAWVARVCEPAAVAGRYAELHREVLAERGSRRRRHA